MNVRELLEKDVSELSVEETAQLRKILGTPSPKEATPQVKNGPEGAIARPVYWFVQVNRHSVVSVKMEKGADGVSRMIINADEEKPRVIATEEKEASKLYWKQGSIFRYLGRSDGKTWRNTRNSGKSITESQDAEFEAFQANPDRTPPINREKTFFAGTTPAAVSRGQEISWGDGFQQSGKRS